MADETKTPPPAPAKSKKTYIRLANEAADGGFVDPVTKFELSRANPVEMPQSIGAMTADLMAKGKIIKCDEKGKALKGSNE